MSYIDVDGKSLYYEIHGEDDRDVLLYLHGGPGASCMDYADQAKMLGAHLKVIIFDQWGVLRSDSIGEKEPYGMDIQLAQIERIRQLLGIDRWSVLGHSYGGLLAVRYGQKYPDAVDKILLECPSLWFPDSARSIARHFEDHFRRNGDMETLAECQRIQQTDYHDNSVMFDLLELLDRVKDPKARNYLHSISFEEYLQCCHAEQITDEQWGKAERHLMCLIEEGTMLENYLPVLKSLHKPVLLMNGRYDPACSRAQIDYVINEVDGAQQVWFENSGHFPRLEEPEKYTQCVLGFLM